MSVAPSDPYGDPFSEDIHDPVVFALNGTDQLYERAQTARQKFEGLLASDPARNVVAIVARQAISEPLAKLAEVALRARMCAAKLRGLVDDALDQAVVEWNGAYAEALRALTEVERLGTLLMTPDDASVQAPEPPLPAVQDWATVSAQVQTDVAAWAARVRGKPGQLLVAKPSAGTGKTRAMIVTALNEQSHRQRVVMAVRTKEMLVGELEPRVRKAGSMVRLHVIQGRDKGTCWNFDNVRAVQEHGYAPGSTVCSRCEYHPDIAKKLRSYTVCPYYRSRQNAQNDTASARFGANDYPLILTTHSGYLTAVESGGGRFGKFWPCDMLMIDEDPTDAFEPEVVVKVEHLMLPTPPKPQDRAAHAMAVLLAATIAQADTERKAMESVGWRADGVRSPIHSKHGSAYAGTALHKLLDRVATGSVGQRAGFRSVIQVLCEVSDSHIHPAAGALHGATTAAAVSFVVPPRGLSQLGEALFEENDLQMQLRRLAYKKVHEKEMLITLTSAQVDAALAESEEFDAAYRVRLEFVKDEWRFVLQNFVNGTDQVTNIIYGDAYASIEHARQIFGKPGTLASDPFYVDPVTVIDRVARFAEGSLLVRHRAKANITYLTEQGGLQDHAAILSEVFRAHAGLRVLIYGHKSLMEWIEKLLSDNADFGMLKPKFEHWGGGRGKDEYGDYDAVITVSDYIQPVDGMLHKVNARAARDTARLVALGRHDEALAEGTRIVFDMADPKTDLTHKMTRSDTHWRLKLEHERVNVNELAQALHRVRGLRSSKRMAVIGDGVPFTRDTIAASVVVNPAGGPPGRGKLRTHYIDGSLTVEEAYTAILQIAEHFGVWSPIFLHAFYAMESRLFHSDATFSVTACQGVAGIVYERDSGVIARDPLPGCLGRGGGHRNLPGARRDVLTGAWAGSSDEAMGGAAHPSMRQIVVPLTLLERVWFPPAGWKLDNERARNNLHRTKEASARAMREFPTKSGKKLAIRPSWEDSAHRGYEWCSLGSVKSGFACATDIIENQYGTNRNGVLYVPNSKPFVPY